MNDIDIVRAFYDSMTESEWNRIAGKPEFLLTCRFLDRYIRPGDRVLDIGGGPGRYSLYLAARGCDVTLFDLASENIKFGEAKARELGLPLHTICGDARKVDTLTEGMYDHVLLMGPLYHLLEEADRVRAVDAACAVLKTGGVLFASFINMYAGMIYEMCHAPELAMPERQDEPEKNFKRCLLEGDSYAGDAFTRAFFIDQNAVLPFMSRFPLEKLHLFGQEGVCSPRAGELFTQPEEIYTAWIDFSEKVCEREELLSWAEHLMYVGRKTI
ncbi:MAG: class I SAM-dependent methyltransferase [Clostridiaceae bacterium]|nr:class I SAM-dependent methyltransferase [Clostridiaceae bacterium]